MATPVIHPQTRTNKRFFESLGTGVQLEMVLIQGGSFLMGSPEDEPERNNNEGPQHQVTVPTFFMSRYPVSQAQWEKVARLPAVNRSLKSNPSKFEGNLRPVEQVNWYEAVEFCDRLTKHTGRTYRLPSEAEWEYACRAGTTSPFYCGETITTDIANYDGNYVYGQGVKGEYRKETTPIDHFKMANPWGLCDMHGNVFEWCLDHWHDSYVGAPDDGSARLSNGDSSFRVYRGGSCYNIPRHCRSAYRGFINPDDQFYLIGFRVVIAPRGTP